METSISTRRLTDGSEVFAVVFVDGSQSVRLECVTEKDALALQDAMSEHVSYATIEGRP